jgi:hypothetical protein
VIALAIIRQKPGVDVVVGFATSATLGTSSVVVPDRLFPDL